MNKFDKEIIGIKAQIGVIQHELNGMSSNDTEALIDQVIDIANVVRDLANVVNALALQPTINAEGASK